MMLCYSMICKVASPFLFQMGGVRTDHLLFCQTHEYHAYSIHGR